ncbi:DUF4236 domain-containing protein [Sporolactobacillus shoreae]|uniref:DUF4236 domain-containing protein n=1 Tax=Sporolactobacillus shoreae TaxID=1465501 RepID=UPI001583BEB3|nr:DUF4236 domain-containing protein [Sporolactobacillus shoreae]
MGFRFRKSFKIAPGIKFNVNKKSVGMTFGTKGAHYTINSKGTRTKSVGIPGTGLSYVDVKNTEKRSSTTSHNGKAPVSNRKGCVIGCLGLIVLFFLIIGIVNLFTGHFDLFFGMLFFISAILSFTSLFIPNLAFWTKKKTRFRAFIGYVIFALIFGIFIGVTSGGQTNTDQTNSLNDAVVAGTSDSADSSYSGDSIDSESSNSSESANANYSNSVPGSSDSSTSSAPSKTEPTVKPKQSSSSAAKKAENSSSKTVSKSSSSKIATQKPAPSLAVTGGSLNVSPGQMTSVSVNTKPGAQGTIQVIYNSGPSTAAGLIPKSADSSGNITWVWKVGTRTAPGDYPVNITVGEKSITQTLHVQ